jgi:hypothetical protein
MGIFPSPSCLARRMPLSGDGVKIAMNQRHELRVDVAESFDLDPFVNRCGRHKVHRLDSEVVTEDREQ